jgi:uncharacterized protein
MRVSIEKNGRVLRGLAVPFNTPTMLVDHRDGLIAEAFDRKSITRVADEVPLLVSHDRDRPPLGKVVDHRQTVHGLEIEARLVDSEAELERWRARWAEKLMTGLSLGFKQGPGDWRRPPERGMPPLKLVRDVEVIEVSVVSWPAYEAARARSLAQRTAEDERRELDSVVAIATGQTVLDKAEARLARRRQ